jgi:hypothetical protein
VQVNVQLGGLVDGAAPRRLLTVFSYGGEFFWKVVYGGGWLKLKSASCKLLLEREEHARKEY